MTERFRAKWGPVRVKKMRQKEGISVLMKIRIEILAG